jgi:S-adenosylmethionine:tRNA ribosyltransferase-isomerase
VTAPTTLGSVHGAQPCDATRCGTDWLSFQVAEAATGSDAPAATDRLPIGVDAGGCGELDPGELAFTLPPELEATAPPEAEGRARNDVRLLVSAGDAEPVHARFDDLPEWLDPGDLVVVNTSGTLAAAVDAYTDDGVPVEVHVSTALPSGLWLVEIREPAHPASRPSARDVAGRELALAGGGVVGVIARYRGSHRLWVGVLDTAGVPVADYLVKHGRPIRYHYVSRDWPLSAYQTVFATEPGSAEMPSAARALTAEVVTRLVARGVGVTPLVLHTGVSSLEGHEQPYPEHVRVPEVTAARVNAARQAERRVIAVGTTVVRALEAAAGPDGVVRPLDRWTDVVITPERGVRVVDGLLTGWHEPEASHLLMLEALAGRAALARAYRAALAAGYRWHEFGDAHLILPAREGS